MSYEKQTWASGDVITAEKLNHMEEGITTIPPIMIIHDNSDTGALDKTWQEIHDFRNEGGIVIGFASMEDNLYTAVIDSIVIDSTSTPGTTYYTIGLKLGDMYALFKTTDPNDYPVYP